ncbi:MAG: hypothetical protein K6G22_03635 [Lachnospiraceae bacterium]|nr:hypothetical protein [Lachnospiraceae bacterium]
MSIYRKERTDAIFNTALEEGSQVIMVVPKMYGVLLAGILILMVTVLSWAVFGTVDDSVAVTGLYAPGVTPLGEVVAFVPISTGKTLLPGMEANISLAGYQTQKMGQMHGKITYVDEGITGINEIRAILKDDMLVNVFIQSGPVVLVVFSLDKDPDSKNGYAWTHSAGENIAIQDLTYTSMTVVKDSVRPITLGISGLAEFFGRK